jgi:hypothetical protein
MFESQGCKYPVPYRTPQAHLRIFFFAEKHGLTPDRVEELLYEKAKELAKIGSIKSEK